MTRTVSLIALLLTAFPTPADDDYRPKIASASRDAELAIQSFVMPEGMSASLLASEPALANPVAFHVAADGKVYVCETFRQEVGVEDNRSHMDWLNNDLRLESVEERLAMFRQYLGDDVGQYAKEHDRIRVLQDTNGDGRFDSDKVFAQGFNDILDGTGAGVIEHDGKIYYTCIPKLWKLEDTNGDGTADNTDSLHHGYGVRVAFRGHDMHGLTVGPDGRLYYSIGDRGYNVITKEGSRLKRVDNGAVFRCDMDGSNLQVFAYGLRNPQELAFDDHGNLWTGDNNSDSGDQARWVYVVQDGDTGWRMYYQYLDDRGPWNRERMWYPYRSDEETTTVQPAFIVPPVANLGDGPSGLTYYPGLGLSERYKNHFFMADFRGGASNSGIRSFSVKPKGATFELTDSHQFIWSILGTDVDFAPDGGLYVTDWVNGWVGEGKGRLYRFVDNENLSAVAGANVDNLLSHGIAKATTPELIDFLGHPDRRVRQASQFEIVRRNAKEELLNAMDVKSDGIEQIHVAWAFWQLGLQSPEEASMVAEQCVKAASAPGEVGVQYIKILSDLVDRHGVEIASESRPALRALLVEATKSENLRRAGFAAAALGVVGRSVDALPLQDLLNRNSNRDPVLRHQTIMGITGLGERDPEILPALAEFGSPVERLAVAVAMRKLKRPEVVSLLGDPDPGVAAEASRTTLAIGGANELHQLAEQISVPGSDAQGTSDPVVVRRSLEAAYRLGMVEHARWVAQVAADENRPVNVRLVAAKMLLTWNNPQQTDTVDGHWRELPKREVLDVDDAISDELPGILAGPGEIRETAIQVAAEMGITNIAPSLNGILKDELAVDESRVAAFRALVHLTEDKSELLNYGRNDSSEGVRIAALELLAESQPDIAVGALKETFLVGTLKSQQKAIALLGRIGLPESNLVLESAMTNLGSSELPDSLTLDLLNAAQETKAERLVKLVTDFRSTQAESGNTLGRWSDCLNGGDVERGKTVFFGRAAASCRRCHMVNGSGAKVGPDLSEIAKEKERAYLLESIVDPNASIAKGFETTVIVDFDGKIHAGIIKEDNEQVVKLMSPQGAIITVAKDEIDERAKGQSGMPSDISRNLSRSDIRDLVAYLATLKVAETTAHGNQAEE